MSQQKKQQRLQDIRQTREELHLTENPGLDDSPEKKPIKSGYAADPQQRDLVRQSFIEQKIQQAINEGAFDNLPGAGKPLNLEKNPYTDPSLGLAHDILKNNELAPEWIERDKSIRHGLDQARHQLATAWVAQQADPAEDIWQAALARFAEQLEKLNRSIDDFNLLAPTLAVHRSRLQFDKELQQITSSHYS